MKIPISWLKHYVPIIVTLEELAHRLTMAGIEVGQITRIGEEWHRDKILIGEVTELARHPNADRLQLPTIDLGHAGTASVVCGAPNLNVGQKIVFAKVGASLYNPRSGKLETLKKAKIRGIDSFGMICSSAELGLDDNHEGILVLEDEAQVGSPLVDYLGDTIFETELTPNRPDCLSITGTAHEVAALTNQVFTEPLMHYSEGPDRIEDQVEVLITNNELCPRYTATLIHDVKVGPSPRWLQDLLLKMGQRPINNVVDITNFVMLEYGQPLHAFDFQTIVGSKVIVRAAEKNETLVTLDGEKRQLSPPMLTIADADNPIGLAGIIGGFGSAINSSTTSVFLESASFSAANTRKTRNALGITTEASYRFERGLSVELAPIALRRATQMILSICGGTAAKGILDTYPNQPKSRVAKVSQGRIRQLLGVELDIDRVSAIMNSLGFVQVTENPSTPVTIETKEGGSLGTETAYELILQIPYWRSDISIQDDIVEEIARIIGYDNLPEQMLSGTLPHVRPQPEQALRERVRDLLVASGMQETISYTLTSLEILNTMGAIKEDLPPLRIANPMNSDKDHLRTTLQSSLLETVSTNRRVVQKESLRLFEIGRVYLPNTEDPKKILPMEKEMLVGTISGPRHNVSWLTQNVETGFHDAKGILEYVMDGIGLDVSYQADIITTLSPGRSAKIIGNGLALGVVGEVRPDILDYFGIQDTVVGLFEVDLEVLANACESSDNRYFSASQFPESTRDLAVLVDNGVESSKIQDIIARHEHVVSSIPFDVYFGPKLPQGTKSIAYSIVFQSNTGTLTSVQIDKSLENIMQDLEQHLGATKRSDHFI